MNKERPPTMDEILGFIGDSAREEWLELVDFISENYSAPFKMAFSKCAAKPGWNVKYHKNGKSLCTIYPEKDSFTVLIVINQKEANYVRENIKSFGQYFIDVFNSAGSLNGCRWLMLSANNKAVVENIKQILQVKVRPRCRDR